MTFFYVVVALTFAGAVVLGIVRLRKMRPNGNFIAFLGALPFSVLMMIKLRCSAGGYACGFMSFEGGFTWHLLAGFSIFVGVWILTAVALNGCFSIGIVRWMEILGRSATPLLGLWIAAVWEILPVSIIHPPAFGGHCPSLPIICHDSPVLGFGGLAYLAPPFVIWAAYTAYRDIKSTLRSRSV